MKKMLALIFLLFISIGLYGCNQENNKQEKIQDIKLENISSFSELEKEILKENRAVIISRTDCPYCITYKKNLKAIKNDYKVLLIELDKLQEKNPNLRNEIITKYNLVSVPTTLFIKDKKIISIKAGVLKNSDFIKGYQLTK